MKKYSIPAISLLLCLLATVIIHAQSTRLKPVTISGFSDSAVSVEIGIHGKYYINEDTYVKQKIKIENGRFNFHFTPENTVVYIRLVWFFPKARPVGLSDYIVEPGDSVFISREENGFSFSGKNGAQFECQYSIKKIHRDMTAVSYASTIGDTYQYLKRNRDICDSTNQEKNKILLKNKKLFSEQVFNLLTADCTYDNNYLFDNMEWFMADFKRDTSQQNALFKYYQDNFSDKKAASFVKKEFLYSKRYINFLLSKIRADNVLATVKYSNYSEVPKYVPAVYNEIENSFKGVLKEMLLSVYFKRLTKIDDIASVYIHKAATTVQDPIFRNYLVETERRTAGAIAYNFKLPDSEGKVHSLSDFRGKVVVVDFWYTGCIWCPVMAKLLKPLAAQKDSNVVFITVAADTDAIKWKRSLKEGKYSSEDEINLYTEGLGFLHPLIKYYQMNLFPTLFVIDKTGRMSAVNPSVSSTDTTQRSKIRKAIEVALR